ncbi:MAG: hypothetical protein AAF846_27580 [Chloroflexota bacterium]
MPILLTLIVIAIVIVGLVYWYNTENIQTGEATVHLQSEHEHFHFHVELPDHMEIKPGDTLHILSVPDDLDAGRTDGERTYTSPVRLHKASWLQSYLTKSSSLMEVVELVDHP